MGCRLHVANINKVKYGETAHFNWKSEQFVNLLEEMNMPYYDESGEAFTKLEIARSDWEAGIEMLKTKEPNQDLSYALADLGCSKDEMINIMESYNEESDKDNDYMLFAFL